MHSRNRYKGMEKTEKGTVAFIWRNKTYYDIRTVFFWLYKLSFEHYYKMPLCVLMGLSSAYFREPWRLLRNDCALKRIINSRALSMHTCGPPLRLVSPWVRTDGRLRLFASLDCLYTHHCVAVPGRTMRSRSCGDVPWSAMLVMQAGGWCRRAKWKRGSP